MSAKVEEMKFFTLLYEWLASQIKQQGLSFVLIAFLAWHYFEKTESCNDTIIKIYQEDQRKHQEERARMLEVIQTNTKAFESFSQILKMQQ